jgi:hypothetical protein
MFDPGVSLNTTNFHYMEAVIHQYPHIFKAIYLPDNYAAIIRLGIVLTSPTEAPITTDLSIGFKIQLPYVTKDGNGISLLVVAGPDIAVNLILGLCFIKAMGMIADFIDNVCQAKHLLCNPFPIEYWRMTKSIPVVGDCNAASHSIKFKSVHRALGLVNAYLARSSIDLLLAARCHQALLRPFRLHHPCMFCWVFPSKSADNTNDYHHQVLEDLGYL